MAIDLSKFNRIEPPERMEPPKEVLKNKKIDLSKLKRGEIPKTKNAPKDRKIDLAARKNVSNIKRAPKN